MTILLILLNMISIKAGDYNGWPPHLQGPESSFSPPKIAGSDAGYPEDTLGFFFNSSMEGWAFIYAPQTIEYLYRTPAGCEGGNRYDYDNVAHVLNWDNWNDTGVIHWYAYMPGFYNDTCDYDFSRKWIRRQITEDWTGVKRLEARIYNDSDSSTHVQILFKSPSNPYGTYYYVWTTAADWFSVPAKSWRTVYLYEPDDPYYGNFDGLEEIAVCVGEFGWEGDLYIDHIIGINPGPMDVPTLVNPEESTITQNNLPTFIWLGNGDSYQLQYDDNPSFSSPTTRTASDTTYTYYYPIPNGDYYWRVRSINRYGDTTSFSETGHFVITGPLEVPAEFDRIDNAVYYANDFDTVLIADGIYNENYIDTDGKAIYIIGSENPENVIIDGYSSSPIFQLEDASGDSAVHIYGLTIKDGLWAFQTYWNAKANVENCIIDSCVNGVGNSYSHEANINIVNCRFMNITEYGVYSLLPDGDSFSMAVENCLFENCGRALWGKFDAVGDTVRNCRVGLGGNKYSNGDNFWADHCVMDNNDTAVYAPYNGTAVDCEIINGTGLIAVVSNYSNLNLNNCNIHHNEGGIIVFPNPEEDAFLYMNYCLYRQNTGGITAFAVTDSASANIILNKCTFANNYADIIYTDILEGSDNYIHVDSCLIAFNDGIGISIDSADFINCCNVFNNAGGDYDTSRIFDQTGINGNISEDPLFCNPGDDNYYLMSTSPCLWENNECQVQIGALGEGCIQPDNLLLLSDNFVNFFMCEKETLPAPDTIVIEGPDDSAWSLEYAGTWYDISKSSGVLPDTIIVTVCSDSLPEGIYMGNLAVNCGAAANSPQMVDMSLHVEPSVEIDSDITTPGTLDSLPVYISHGSLSGFFIPLKYTSLYSASPDSIVGFTIDTVIIDSFYLYNCSTITVTVDTNEHIILVDCPIQDPPLPPPDTAEATLLAMIVYQTTVDAADQVIRIDTTTTACPGWVPSGRADSCTIGFYEADSGYIPNFEPGYIVIGDTSGVSDCGILQSDPDSIYLSPGKIKFDTVGLYQIGGNTVEYDLISPTSVINISPSFGQTPNNIIVELVGLQIDTALVDSILVSYANSSCSMYVNLVVDSGRVTDVHENSYNLLPDEFRLRKIYPNPSNISFTIAYDVPRKSRVVFSVYNILGRQVAVISEEAIEAGRHELIWEAKDKYGTELPSGVYFINMAADNYRKTEKLILLK